ncbi:MAG: sialidase family protein, partial [Chloroflexota bacterium]
MIALGLFLYVPTSVWSQGPGLRTSWSTIVNLSLTAETVSRYPTIASDRMGNVHVAWVEEQGDQDGTSMIYYRMWDRQRWSTPTDIILGKWLLLPSLAVDSKGVIHLVYVSGSALMYSRAQANGQPWTSRAWSTPVTLGSNIIARWPEIHVDAQDRLYVLYSADYTTSVPKVALVYSSDSGGAWSEPAVISNSGMIASTEFSNVNRLAIGPRGTLYAIWGEGKNESTSTQTLRVFFSRSESGGAAWNRPVLLSDNTKPGAEALAIIVDNRERVHVLWRNRENFIVHQWSENDGVKWSSPQPITGTQESQRYGGVSVVGDNVGNFYMSYV